MFCTSCGEKIDILAKFCSGCGKSTKKSKISPYLEAALGKPAELASKYRERIKPHHEKITRYLPPIAGFILAVTLVFTTIVPAHGRRMVNIGREHLASARHYEAAAAFRLAGAVFPLSPEVNTLKSYALITIGDFERARDILLDKEDEHINAASLRLLADVWHHKGERQMYADTLRELIRLTPNDPQAYFRLSAFYRDSGLFENAANTLEALLARKPNSAATAELYNIFKKSFALNTSRTRALNIRSGAMAALNTAGIESLNVGGGRAVSLSPSGGYIAVYNRREGARYIDIYELTESEFRPTAAFRLPANYIIDPGMLAWSPDERMIAFFNSGAEKFVSDSSIHIGNIASGRVFNLTDPGADFTRYLSQEGVFVIDSLPVFSPDSQRIYFARRTVKGNWLMSIDINGSNLIYHFEPPNGGYVEYKIITRSERVFFSVAGPGNNPLWGIYVYESGAGRRLNFDFDNRLYYLALKDITVDGRFLLYYLTVASQNNAMLFGVINLETMERVNVYRQEMDLANGRVVAMNRSNIFGTYYTFITRNAAFSRDGRSLIVAEDGGNAYGKVIRRFPLEGGAVGVGSFVYLSFDTFGADMFCVPEMNQSGVWFREIGAGEFLVYSNGFRLLRLG